MKAFLPAGWKKKQFADAVKILACPNAAVNFKNLDFPKPAFA